MTAGGDGATGPGADGSTRPGDGTSTDTVGPTAGTNYMGVASGTGCTGETPDHG